MHTKVRLDLRSRVTAFIASTTLVVVLIALGTWASWVRIHTLRTRLTAEGLGSNDISDQFQQRIGNLNTELFRFAVGRDGKVWSKFKEQSVELDRWIDKTFRELQSLPERGVVRELDRVFDDYIKAADRVEIAIDRPQRDESATSEFTESDPEAAEMSLLKRRPHNTLTALADFELQEKRILALGSRLADLHKKAIESFVDDANQSLEHVMLALLFGLVLLLLCGGGLAWVIYRELIAPLRVQLIESRLLMERHEKLVSLGMLAAGVAHEIRNPLTAIKARLFSLRRRLPPASQDRSDTDVIDSEINRLERIVKDFLLFARPSDPELAVMRADAALHEVKLLLGPQLEKKGIALTVQGDANAWIRVDRHQIKQVLINLIQNAADATALGGEVILRARCDHGRLGDHLADVVVLEVEDSGQGIVPEVQARLFDPFFSTKDGGTGLGLSIASRIVEKHGGALQYQTKVDSGTTFGIVLPRVSEVPVMTTTQSVAGD